MCFAGCQRKAHRQSPRIDDRVNVTRQSTSRLAHRLLFVACDTGRVLVHAHGCVDRLHGRAVSGDHRIQDLIPDASPSPANEAIVAGRVGTKAVR